jgi:hypothetical protein
MATKVPPLQGGSELGTANLALKRQAIQISPFQGEGEIRELSRVEEETSRSQAVLPPDAPPPSSVYLSPKGESHAETVLRSRDRRV